MLKQRKRISELEIQYFVFQIIEGLKYTHSNKVIHRE
jgi:serine/threonine protein kinase